MSTTNLGKAVRRGLLGSFFALISAVLLHASAATAAPTPPRGIPQCLSNEHGVLPVMNEQVLKWKLETPNQWQARALVSGQIEALIKKRATHTHVKVRLGRGDRDTVEIVYNNAFGALPRIQPGMITEICGDYITARSKAGPYPPSPEGAIIHWVHINSRGGAHEDGFFRIDGVVYGNRPSEVGGRRFNMMDFFITPDAALEPVFSN